MKTLMKCWKNTIQYSTVQILRLKEKWILHAMKLLQSYKVPSEDIYGLPKIQGIFINTNLKIFCGKPKLR